MFSECMTISSSRAAGVEIVLDGRRIKARSHFETLLTPRGLNGTVARAEMHRMTPRAIGKHLNFQMIEILDALLDEHAFVLELTHGVVADAAVHLTEHVDVIDFFNAHAAAARRGFTSTSGRAIPCCI